MVERVKKIVGIVLLTLAMSLPLATPSIAFAQNQSSTIVDWPRVGEWIVKIWDNYIKDALIQSVATILINTMTYAADRLAYDAAVYISSGGEGEDPLFDNRNVGDYAADFGASVAGEALSQIDDSGLLGTFKVCNPKMPSITLAFKFGVKGLYEREEPGCDVKDVLENWDGFMADIEGMSLIGEEKNALIITQLAEAFNPSSNDFSVGIQLTSSILTQAQEQKFLEAQKFLLTNGFKDKTDFLTKKVDTPAQLLQNNLETNLKKPQDKREEVGAVILGSGKDVLLQMGLHAGQVFASTLLSKGIEKMYNGLFADLDEVEIDPFDSISYSNSSADSARDAFRSFLAAAPLEITNYSILGEFGACPTVGRGLYNCVADTSFVSAVARADGGGSLTVAEAIEEGLLHEDWPLIKSTDTARNQDPFCFSYGYCHGNLVKLRKARIIPVGWELAAESEFNNDNSPVTLGEVVDGFDDCPEDGVPDESHKWCHLIDPDWVLKYPDTQCRAQVYGQLLKAPSTDQRDEECVDMPSCISEDDDGTCVGGYGYCVREENIWRFRGEDCPDYYGTCTAYENSEGEDASLLASTVDAGECTEDSVGCLWYATQKTDDTGDFDWPDIADVEAADADADAYRERIYFTAAIEDCSSGDAGCRELVERDDDLSFNMITNPGFEDDEDDDGVPDGWSVSFLSGSPDSVPEFSVDATYSLSGANAVSPGDSSGAGDLYQSGIILRQATQYTLSFYARQATSGGSAVAYLLIAEDQDAEGNGILDAIDTTGTELAGDCEVATPSVPYRGYKFASIAPSDTTYERYDCTFTVPTVSDASLDVIGTLMFSASTIYIDNVQLEQDAEASDWHEGYSDTSLALAYYKAPPSYLGCTGDDGEPEACDDYAAVCAEQDVGCSAYTPANGDPDVIGVANALDECPSSCVGYDTFKQEETRYEPEGDFPVYFIPDTATECSEEDVGCDEFTNESTEEIEYFTYLRACVTEDQALANISGDNKAVFYTWEGSDLDGYQLKTWILLQSDLGSTRHVHASGEIDTIPGSAPCTTWQMNATGTGIQCDDDDDDNSSVDGALASDTADCDQHSDVLTNPDCREFYDAQGNIHYREWSSTVTVTDSCVAYRKTEIVGDDATEKAEACEDSGGYYESTSGICRYFGYADESDTCDEQASGCREYTGGRSRNSRLAFTEYFEGGTLENWDADADVTLSNESVATDGHSMVSEGEAIWTYLAKQSSACTTELGCEGTEGALGGTCTIENGETTCGTLDGELFEGKTYTLSFWAKGSGTLDVGFDISADPTSVSSSTVDEYFTTTDITLETGWNEYSLGPLDMNNAGFGDGTVLVFLPSDTVYIDNVILREGEDNITVIKDSWVTPAECDETPEGTDSPQYYLGCAEYTDQNGDTAYLKSFSSLCSEDQVGCESFYMTQESDATHAQVFGAVCSNDPENDGVDPVETATDCYWESDGASFVSSSKYLCTIGVGLEECEFDIDFYVPPVELPDHISYAASTTVVPSDREVFLVVNDNVSCTSDVAGCTELGLPTFSQDHSSVSSWESVYLVNDPDDYADTLCTADELFCDAWTTQEGATDYFKNPQDQTCEYKSNVTISGTRYDGWFKTGTDELCYEDYVIGGDTAGIWRNGDTDYDNWVGTCEEKYDGCTEYQDLTDLEDDELYGDADGDSYFYLDNDALDESSLPSSQQCNDQVSQKDGCALFNNTGEPEKDYNTSASYILSIHADDLLSQAPNSAVDPIDCESGTEESTFAGVDLCQRRCKYDEAVIYTLDESPTYDGSCYDSDDCRPIEIEPGEATQGSCVDVASAYRLENDANVVLKVNRDRECSEWLSCIDSVVNWDERTNSYKSVCTDVELCTEYSTTTGNASFCSEWNTDDVESVLDEEKYTTRNTTWYGDEYSGYAIPGLLPVQTLTQVNVAPPAGYCNTAGTAYGSSNGEACEDDSQCGLSGSGNTVCPASSDPDYRLAYSAGSCDEDYGEECTVGYCADSGSACSGDDDCSESVSCIVGYCLDVDSTAFCEIDEDCTDSYYNICSSGVCAAVVDSETTLTEYQDSSYSCPSQFVNVATKDGSCVRGQCLLTIDGEPLTDAVEVALDSECRGYPEMNSPFPNDVVESWRDPQTENVDTNGDGTPDDTAQSTGIVDIDAAYDHAPDMLPYELVTSFDRAQTCAAGEDCDCSYSKVTFGEGAYTRYFGEEPLTMPDGLCTVGDHVGRYCESAEDCGDDGICSRVNQVDDVLGMPGYCLEHDTSVNILGDREQFACLSWLPVDQLAGSTDLYAKYTSAGYFQETFACTYVAPYVDLKMSSHSKSEGGIACAEVADQIWGDCVNEWGVTDNISFYASVFFGEDANPDGRSSGCEESDYDGCAERADLCPEGYWALMGQPSADKGSTTFAEQCDEWMNDCPYVCIPYGAVDTAADNASCDPNGEHVAEVLGRDWDYTSEVHDTDGTIDNDVYIVGKTIGSEDSTNTGEEIFDNVVGDLSACRLVGVEYSDELVQSVMSHPPATYYYNYTSAYYCRYEGERADGTTGYVEDWSDVDCIDTDEDDDDGDGDDYYIDNDDENEPDPGELEDECFIEDGEDGDTVVGDCVMFGGGDEDSSGRDGYRTLSLDSDGYVGCKEIAQVAGPTSEANAAHSYIGTPWTNRLYGYEHGGSFTISSDGDALDYTHSTPQSPFGLPPGRLVEREDYDPPVLVATCDREDDGELVPGSADASADTPYCPSGYNDDSIRTGETRTSPSSPETRSFADFSFLDSRVAGEQSVNAQWDSDGLSTMYGRLTQIFANVVSQFVYQWDGGFGEDEENNQYDPADDEDTSSGTSDDDVRAENGNPPAVYAVDTNNCEGSVCREDEDHPLTINEQNNGDIEADEYYRAYLKFYAAADKNQLPLRRVIIDWGDLSNPVGSTTDDNFYMNHRGLDDDDEQICTTAEEADEWGKTEASCDSQYFNYNHTYTCNPRSMTEACEIDTDGNLVTSPCYNGNQESCSFQPRVHVMDNWGFCTGVCGENDYDDDGRGYCFDGEGSDDSSLEDSTNRNSECAFGRYPDEYWPEIDPWVYYDGIITLTP